MKEFFAKISKTKEAIPFYTPIKYFLKKINKAAIAAYSGQTAYMLILSFFPFFLFLLSLLQLTPVSKSYLLTAMQLFLPESLGAFVLSLIDTLYQNHFYSLLPITVLFALWPGSKAFLSLIRGLNSIYKIEETRNWFILRFWSVLYTILFAILLLSTLTVLVFGNSLFLHFKKYFPFLEESLLPFISLRSVIAFLVMLLFFTLLYKSIPNFPKEKKIKFTSQLPGALLATSGWLSFSFLYSYYIDHFSNYIVIYGSMAAIAFLMVWLYACMYMLFLGGLLNFVLQDKDAFFQEMQDSVTESGSSHNNE